MPRLGNTKAFDYPVMDHYSLEGGSKIKGLASD